MYEPLGEAPLLRLLRSNSSLNVEDSGPLLERLLSAWQGQSAQGDDDLAALQFLAGGQT